MFESLDDTMKHDEQAESTPQQRMMKWAAVLVIALIVFGGLIFGVRMLE
jgi:hypothetical protein